MSYAALCQWHRRGLPATFALQVASLALLAALALIGFLIGAEHLPQLLALALTILLWIRYATLAMGTLTRTHAHQLEATERFRLIYEKTSEAILFTWPDGRIETANPAACRLFDCSEATIRQLGRDGLMDITDPRLPPALEERARTGSFYGELRCRRPDGSTFPAELMSAQFLDANGTARATIMIRDISERLAVAEHLKAVSQSVVDAQENARRRLAGELHAQTSANLAAIGINLEIAALALQERDWDELGTRMQDNAALIATVSRNIRQLCSDLRPPALDYAGLLAGIEAYASQYSLRTGIAVEVVCRHGNIRKAPALESMLFRIFQEALTNSLKHAGASEIEVTLDLESQPLVLQVCDNGIGFEPQAAELPGGHGVVSMREMAEYSGGTFHLRSEPGKGTQIRVEV